MSYYETWLLLHANGIMLLAEFYSNKAKNVVSVLMVNSEPSPTLLSTVSNRQSNCIFILFFRADIITLQEVESDQFYTFFFPELAREGYEGVFSPKSRAKTMNENERKRVDGCAIFFK